jgi:hypothetical protein
MSSNVKSLAALIIVAAIATSAGAAAANRTAATAIHSTLDGKTVLPIRTHWIARPSVPPTRVKSVSFSIDGRLAWVEHNAPYVFADDGNWLVTTVLNPGRHVFRTTLLTKDGQRSSDTVTARVLPAPTPPGELAGTWSRTATKDDLKKCTTAAESGCPPTGNWKITIGSRGWAPTDPQGNRGLFDVIYLGNGRVQLRPTIEYPPFPNINNGGWCSDTDPLSTWTTTVDLSARTLTLQPEHSDPCGDRAAILEGTWQKSE